jgi:hypothetical protein
MFGKRVPFMIEARPSMNRKSIVIGSKIMMDDGPFVISKIHSVEVLNGGICRIVGMCKPAPKEIKQ